MVETTDYEPLADLAAAGIGVAVVPARAVRARADLVAVPTDLSRRLSLATRATRMTAATSAVVAELRRHADR